MDCFCCFFSSILELLKEDAFWSFTSVITTGLIGFFAYRIAKSQHRIEKHKQDDFLFSHRLKLYSDFFYNLGELKEEKI